MILLYAGSIITFGHLIEFARVCS